MSLHRCPASVARVLDRREMLVLEGTINVLGYLIDVTFYVIDVRQCVALYRQQDLLLHLEKRGIASTRKRRLGIEFASVTIQRQSTGGPVHYHMRAYYIEYIAVLGLFFVCVRPLSCCYSTTLVHGCLATFVVVWEYISS